MAMETTEQEKLLFEQIKALDGRVLQVDNVPRVSMDFASLGAGDALCICVKVWSEKHQEAMYVESMYSSELVKDGIGDALTWLSGPMGIMATFEQEEALRNAKRNTFCCD